MTLGHFLTLDIWLPSKSDSLLRHAVGTWLSQICLISFHLSNGIKNKIWIVSKMKMFKSLNLTGRNITIKTFQSMGQRLIHFITKIIFLFRIAFTMNVSMNLTFDKDFGSQTVTPDLQPPQNDLMTNFSGKYVAGFNAKSTIRPRYNNFDINGTSWR